jgi:hypothetical protein
MLRQLLAFERDQVLHVQLADPLFDQNGADSRRDKNHRYPAALRTPLSPVHVRNAGLLLGLAVVESVRNFRSGGDRSTEQQFAYRFATRCWFAIFARGHAGESDELALAERGAHRHFFRSSSVFCLSLGTISL